MVDLRLTLALAANYRSPCQKIRVMSEHWIANNAVCPACANAVERVPNNRPGLDFVCRPCDVPFELKSKRGAFGPRIVDGAYETMIGKIMRNAQSNFFLLTYDKEFAVTDLVLVPKRFIVPEIVEKRKPLSGQARRAGWTGCNLRIALLPDAAKIAYVRDRILIPTESIVREWQKTSFLEKVSPLSRGWLVAVMNCVERLHKRQFSLRDMYEFVPHLQTLFPNNQHIRPKIRQQLQILRDQGWLTFLGSGEYERKSARQSAM